MGYLNKVILMGNVGNSVEKRQLKDGSTVHSFSLATSEYWKDKVTGEKASRTEWHRVVVMNPRLGEIIDKFVRKGSKVYVEGNLTHRQWKDDNGNTKSISEVVVGKIKGDILVFDKFGSSDKQEEAADVPAKDKPKLSTPNALDDDLPF